MVEQPLSLLRLNQLAHIATSTMDRKTCCRHGHFTSSLVVAPLLRLCVYLYVSAMFEDSIEGRKQTKVITQRCKSLASKRNHLLSNGYLVIDTRVDQVYQEVSYNRQCQTLCRWMKTSICKEAWIWIIMLHLS